MIGGRWVVVDEAQGPGMEPILKMGREGARKTFEDSHGYNNPGR